MAVNRMTTIRSHGDWLRINALTNGFKNETLSGVPLKRKQKDRESNLQVQPFNDGTGRFSIDIEIVDRYEKTTDHVRDMIILDKDQVAQLREALGR